MKRLLFAACLALLPALALGAEDDADVDIAGTKLAIPAPDGCKWIASDLPYARLMERFVPPQNRQLALFLTEDDAAIVADGEVPEPTRLFYVQTAKAVVDRFATSADFAAAKKEIKSQHASIAKEVEKQMPGFMEDVNKGISAEYNVDVALSVSQVVPLPPHHESDRSLAISMLTKYAAAGAGGNPVSWEAAVTTTLVHVKGKILFLYATAERSDLEWSREASGKWAGAVIAANPSVGAVAEQERRGFDLGGIFKYGVIGAVAGGVLGALKKKKRPRDLTPVP